MDIYKRRFKAKQFKLRLYEFIQRDRSQHYYIYITFFVTTVLWFLFKLSYPYPYFTFDTYDYLRDAVANIDVSYRPIGYSKFIKIISELSHSSFFIVTIQYLLLQFSLLLLFLTLRYLKMIGSWGSRILFVILFINPLLIDASNHWLSDVLFTALSIIWFTVLLWLVNGSFKYMFIILSIIQALIFVAAFSIRYNAIYFPIISLIAILITRQQIILKISCLFFQFALMLAVINFIKTQNAAITGVKQYSPSGGWKLANNALYMFDKVNKELDDNMPKEFFALDSFVNGYFHRPHAILNLIDSKDFTSGSYYMFISDSPLKQFLYYKYNPPMDYKKYSLLSPLYQAYGAYLIKKYPGTFIRYVIWQCFQSYWFPMEEVFKGDNIRDFFPSNEEERSLVFRFIKPLEFKNLYKFGILRDALFKYFPALFSMIHIIFTLLLFPIFWLYKEKLISPYKMKILIIGISLIVINLLFNSLLTISLIRYEMFTIIIEASFVIAFIDIIINKMDTNNKPSRINES